MTQSLRVIHEDFEGTLYIVDARFDGSYKGFGTFTMLPFGEAGYSLLDQKIEGGADRLRTFVGNKPELFINWVRERFGLNPKSQLRNIETLSLV